MAKKKPATKNTTKATDKVTIEPLGDRVVVEREDAETVTAGGIVLPDSAQNKPTRGKIVSIGNGRLLDDGTRSKMQVKKGDRVLFNTYAGEEFKLGSDEFILLREDDVLAVVE